MNFDVPEKYRISEKLKPMKNDVKNNTLSSFYSSMKKGDIELSNKLCAQLISHGYLLIVLELLIDYYFQVINYEEPALMNYLYQQYMLCLDIKKKYTGNTNNLCNDQELRNHLSEIVTIFAISKKISLYQIKIENIQIDQEIADKTNKFLDMFMKLLSLPQTQPQSEIHQNLFCFVAYYFTLYSQFHTDNELSRKIMGQCLNYLNWFVYDDTYTTDVDLPFKISKTISKKSFLIIIKFIISQITSQINSTSVNVDEINEMIEQWLTFYLVMYKKKQYETCVNIMMYLVLFSVNMDHINDMSIDNTHTDVIRQVMKVNTFYRSIDNGKGSSLNTDEVKKYFQLLYN